MPNHTKEELIGILKNLTSNEVQAEAKYERATGLANEAGFPEVAVGVRQMRKEQGIMRTSWSSCSWD